MVGCVVRTVKSLDSFATSALSACHLSSIKCKYSLSTWPSFPAAFLRSTHDPQVKGALSRRAVLWAVGHSQSFQLSLAATFPP